MRYAEKSSLSVILAIALLAASALACQTVAGTPSAPVQPTLSATDDAPATTPPTVPSQVQATAAPTEAVTVAPTQPATSLPPTLPPATQRATQQPESEELAILSFTVDAEDIASGKRLTFNWETTGATRGVIWSGTTQRYPQAWAVSLDGSLTVELAHTFYRNPLMTLVVYDAADNQVSQSLTVDWPCMYTYFFEPGFDACPLYEASLTWAAEQSFENGRMIWLEEIHGESYVAEGLILVFYNDGGYEQYEDTWTDAEPESDPGMTPPAGLYQPTRGFGKLWRERPNVRDRLGWALAPEQGFDSAWQQRIVESIPGVAFVRTLDGKIIEIGGWGWETGGNWKFVMP